MLRKRLDGDERLQRLGALPVVRELLRMRARPFADEAQSACRQRPVEDTQRFKLDLCEALAVLGVEVGRGMVGSIHPNHDPIEGGETGHETIVEEAAVAVVPYVPAGLWPADDSRHEKLSHRNGCFPRIGKYAQFTAAMRERIVRRDTAWRTGVALVPPLRRSAAGRPAQAAARCPGCGVRQRRSALDTSHRNGSFPRVGAYAGLSRVATEGAGRGPGWGLGPL